MTLEEAKTALYKDPSCYVNIKPRDLVFDFLTKKEHKVLQVNMGVADHLPVSFFIDSIKNMQEFMDPMCPGNLRMINEIVPVPQEVQNDISRSESGSVVEPVSTN